MGPRAVLFDLDDTLYAERRFAVSGMRAVARGCGGDARDHARRLGILLAAIRGGRRDRAFQELCAAEGWPAARIPDLVHLFRRHTPALTLPAASHAALTALRAGWRVGIVTNGLPDVQARKVAALGLPPLLDVVIYAAEWGSGSGKPAPEPFVAAAAALGVRSGRCVFVGNDPGCDVAGARAVGMRTVRVRRGVWRGRLEVHEEADAVVDGVGEVPALAPGLLDGRNVLCA